MLRLCTALALAFLFAAPSSAQSPAPDTAQPRRKVEAKRVAIFAHYGDLNQQYDGTPGSEDRRSSYDLPEAAFLGAPGALADTDNPMARPDRCFPFVLSGYCPFDPRSLIAGSLRFDVFVNDFEQAPQWSLELLTAEGAHATIFYFGSGLRDALTASNQIRPQWVSLHFDLVTGELSAHEINPFGQPIRGREYPNIGINRQWLEHGHHVTPEAKLAVQQAASKGSLCGIVAGGARVSFVSLNATALPRGPAPVLQPRAVQVLRGHSGRGSPSSLSDADDDIISLAPETGRSDYTSEIRCAFVVHRGLLESAGEDATIRIVGDISGAVPAAMVLSAAKPDSEELVTLDSHPLGTSSKDRNIREVRLPRWRQLVVADDRLLIHIRVSRPILLGPDSQLSPLLHRIATRPEISLDLCQLTFEIPPTEPLESPNPPASTDPAR